MSRFTKYLTLSILILFILACSTVTQPFRDAQDLAETAQSFATNLPVETLQAIGSAIPQETLEALPDIQSYFNPQGTPVSEWNGIPVMEQATAGQEFADTSSYSFKVDATVQESQDFYNEELQTLGWNSLFTMPGNETMAVLTFQKDNSVLTVTITNVNGEVVVLLTLA